MDTVFGESDYATASTMRHAHTERVIRCGS